MTHQNLYKVAKTLSSRTNIKTISIINDYLYCHYKYHITLFEYQLFDCYKMTNEEKQNLLTNKYNQKLIKTYNNDKDKDKFNRDSIDIMLKNKLIEPSYVDKLIDKGKINIDGIVTITIYNGEEIYYIKDVRFKQGHIIDSIANTLPLKVKRTNFFDVGSYSINPNLKFKIISFKISYDLFSS